MTRVKRGSVARHRRNKVLSQASGYYGSHSRLFRTAMQQRMKALKYEYRDRRCRRRDFRRLWITRIGSMARIGGKNYNKFIHSINTSVVTLNRRSLAQLAVLDYKSYLMSSLL